MSKVLIERLVAESLESSYENYIKETMLEVAKAPGFVRGEALQDKHNRRHYLVVSTWTSEYYWQKWFQSRERKAVVDRLTPLLEVPEKCTVLVNF